MDILQPINNRIMPANAVLTASSFTACILDFFSRGIPQVVYLGFALVALFAVLYFLKKCRLASGKIFEQPVFLYIGLFAFIMAAGAIASTTKKEQGGFLASSSETVRSLQEHFGLVEKQLAAIQSNVEQISVAIVPGTSQDPVLELKKRGYGLDGAAMARAVTSADLPALALYRQAGNRLPYSTDGDSNIEQLIIDKNPRLPEVLDAFKAQGQDFDLANRLGFFIEHSLDFPRLEAVIAMANQKSAGGIFVPMPNLRANALTLAVWFDNREAAAKLLALGANPDKGVVADVMMMPKMLAPQSGKPGDQNRSAPAQKATPVQKAIFVTSARQEAKKLGRAWFADAMLAAK